MRPNATIIKGKSILCRLHDLNTRPSDYKSDALPTELSRLLSYLLRATGLTPPRPQAPDPSLPIPPNPHINMTRTGLEPVTL